MEKVKGMSEILIEMLDKYSKIFDFKYWKGKDKHGERTIKFEKMFDTGKSMTLFQRFPIAIREDFVIKVLEYFMHLWILINLDTEKDRKESDIDIKEYPQQLPIITENNLQEIIDLNKK